MKDELLEKVEVEVLQEDIKLFMRKLRNKLNIMEGFMDQLDWEVITVSQMEAIRAMMEVS